MRFNILNQIFGGRSSPPSIYLDHDNDFRSDFKEISDKAMERLEIVKRQTNFFFKLGINSNNENLVSSNTSNATQSNKSNETLSNDEKVLEISPHNHLVDATYSMFFQFCKKNKLFAKRVRMSSIEKLNYNPKITRKVAYFVYVAKDKQKLPKNKEAK